MSNPKDLSGMKVSAAVRKLNPGLFAGPGLTGDEQLSPEHESLLQKAVGVRASKPRLRQSTKPLMNKLETRFYETKLKLDYSKCTILIQAVRLELARGIWYKPDFFIPATLAGGSFQMAIAYEVKGPKAFRGGFENLKVAARIHPWVRFCLVWEDEDDGHWERQEILT